MSHHASDIITPKALLLDERLTPLERNVWLTFRALASSNGTVVLSYDALRGYLPSAPGSKRALLETVSRAVLCLQLSTWIIFQIDPPTPLNFSTKAAIFWKTVCFLVRNCGFNGLILGRTALSSVPFSLANSRLSEVMM